MTTIKVFPSPDLARAEVLRVKMNSALGFEKLELAQAFADASFSALLDLADRVAMLERSNEKESK